MFEDIVVRSRLLVDNTGQVWFTMRVLHGTGVTVKLKT